MSWVAVAIGGAAVIGGVSSNQAAKKQAQGTDRALDIQQQQFDTIRGDTQAHREAGIGAVNKLADILGIERSFGQSAPTRAQFTYEGGGSPSSGLQGDGNYVTLNGKKAAFDPLGSKLLGGKKKKSQPQSYFDQAGFDAANLKYQQELDTFNSRKKGLDAFTADPGYQFRLDNTNKAIDRYQSSGRITGGRAIKEAQRYGQDFASNEFSNATNRLFTLAGLGTSANNTSAAAGQNYANQAGNINMQAGNNAAQNYANINNQFQQGLNNYMTYRTYNRAGVV